MEVLEDDLLPYSGEALVTMLSNGEADIALGPIMLSASDMENVDMLSPWLATGHILVIQKPSVSAAKVAHHLSVFVQPRFVEISFTVALCS